MWGAIAFGDVVSAIAKRSVGIAFGYVGMWECDSEALRRNRFWRCWNAIAFGVWGCDRFWGLGVRSLFGILGVRSLFGDVVSAIGVLGVRSLFGDLGMRSLFGDLGMRSLF
jgi:hypothetical protein